MKKLISAVLVPILFLSAFTACGSSARSSPTAADAGSTASAAGSSSEQGPDYPTKTITVICPFGPGGGNDTVARIVSAHAKEFFGVNMIVQNESGGNTMPGSAAVAKAKPDGYTVLINNNVNITAATHVYKANFDVKDLKPVATPGNSSNIFCAGPASPAKTFDGFIKYCQENPGKVTVSCGGALNGDGLALYTMMKVLNIDFTVIPYSSGSEQISALLGGHVNYSCIGGSNITGYMHDSSSGMIPLADVALDSKSPYGVPTLSELGHPDATVATCRTFYVPAATPDSIVKILESDFEKMFNDPDVQKKFDSIAEPCTHFSIDSAALYQQQLKDYDAFGDLIKELNLANKV